MKPRARRITIGAAALVAVVVTVLVAANWATVHDHIEAWRFQLMGEVDLITPNLTFRGPYTFRGEASGTRTGFNTLCRVLADFSNTPVLMDSTSSASS